MNYYLNFLSTLKAEKEEILHQKALINSKMSEFAAQFVNLNSSEINVTTLSSLDSILTEVIIFRFKLHFKMS
jgi:hypothetical protein